MTFLSTENRLICLVGSFLVAAAWFFSGLRTRFLPFFGIAAGILFILTLFDIRVPKHDSHTRDVRVWWVMDLFFWFGLMFLLYLGIQWWNAGRALYYDVEFHRWTYAAPRYPGWPWAFTRQESLEMVYWFFPAWVLGLAMRVPCLTRQGIMQMGRWLSYSGGALATFGLIQYVSGTKSIFWVIPFDGEFFSSFPYSNHAAAYFVLVGGVTAGFFFREVFQPLRERARGRALALGTALVLCLMGANLSLSRTGIVLAWLLAAFIAGYGILRGWRLLRPSARLIWVAATLATFITLYFAVASFGLEDIRREFSVERRSLHSLMPALQTINTDLAARPMQCKAGWSVFKADPLFGVGGWGFRYLAAFHVPPEHIKELQYSVAGWANVHCDPIQFLAEFGLAGCGLMVLALGTLIAPCLRRRIRRGAVFTLSFTGLILVLGFSLIDLPFRCPAILWTWVAVIAALPKCAGAGMPEGQRGRRYDLEQTENGA
ncbi:MAG: O-antigen ligase family protein [Pontiellaceae bacterium]|jgi:O-antigen ligase|nr:O-antigen ligase family protein [Pontiellaceae bacterium]